MKNFKSTEWFCLSMLFTQMIDSLIFDMFTAAIFFFCEIPKYVLA